MKPPLCHRILAPSWLPLLSGIALVALSTAASAVERTYRYYRFSQTSLRNNGAANSIQLSEFEFVNGGSLLSLTGVTVTNPGGDSPPQNDPTPGGEEPSNLIDGNTGTKWLDFNKAPVVFDFGVATTIDGYNFATANDSDERDPVSWTFEGSNDNAAWALLDVINNYPTPTNRFTFAVADATTGFPLQAVVITDFSADKTIVLDGASVDLDWTSVFADSVTITPGIGAVPTSGSFTANPPDSSDITYTLTATNVVDGSVTRDVFVRSVAGGTANFRYTRFTPVRLRGGVSPGAIQLSELRFRDGVTVLDPVAVTNPGVANPQPGEGPGNLNDNDTNTKWFNNGPQPLVYDFGTAVDFDNYYFSTANDSPERDPIRWILEGSNDQSAWTLLDNVNFDFPTPLARFTQIQDIPLPGSSLVPSIARFIGDAPKLIAGQPLLLTWNTVGAATVTINNGVGTVAASGTIAVNPAVDTTYTLTATSPGGSVTSTFATEIINPAVTTIDYENFDIAGDELATLGDAGVVNDFANISLPGDVERLRLTPNTDSKQGFAWFRKRVDLSTGFQSHFDLQFINFGNTEGADGIAFIIQNTPEGTGATFNEAENGLASNALNISFDSYDNDGGGPLEPGSAFIRVREGATVLATSDLFPLLGIADFTQNAGSSAAYRVQVDYLPGDLDVHVNGTLVVNSVNVNLASIGAVNASGKGYVGFAARTGGFFENHDVTRWQLVEGPPPPLLVIKNSVFNFATDQVQLTWSSADTRTYKITTSTDLVDWTTVVASGIPGATGLQQTSATVGFTQGTKGFFRVEEE